MTKLLFSSIVIFFLIVISIKNIYASLTINEIYPAPAAGEYEWVEFYNLASFSADLSDYVFDDDPDFDSDSGSGSKISLSGILPENSTCYWELSNYLNNNGDKPTLFKIDGSVVDTYTYTTTQTSKSYSRIPDGGEWQINVNSTRSLTRCLDLVPTPTSTLTPNPTITPNPTTTSTSPTPSPSPSPTSTSIPVSYDNIYLSEVYPYPQTEENEWLEFYNDNDFSVELNNWYFDDVENGGSSPKSFSLTIDQKSYAVFDLSSSMFNNDGDSVRLLDFNKNLKDSFEYTEGEKSKSWGRVDFQSDQYCLQEPTKNSVNGSCLNQTVAVSSTSTLLPTSKTTETKNKVVASYKPLNSIPLLNLTKKQSKPINQSTTVLGINTETPTVNTDKPLLTSLTLVSFFNSLLTIFSVLLKIKIHEGV